MIFAGKSVAVGDIRKETVSLCAADWVLVFPLQTLKQDYDKFSVTSLI